MNDNSVTARFAGATWRKSSRSASSGQCVEIAEVPGWVGVRDSKLGTDSPILAFTRAEWKAFSLGMRDGEFD